MKIKILNCANCGSSDVDILRRDSVGSGIVDLYEVICYDCQMRTGAGDLDDVVNTWNNRYNGDDVFVEINIK